MLLEAASCQQDLRVEHGCLWGKALMPFPFKELLTSFQGVSWELRYGGGADTRIRNLVDFYPD